MTSDLFDPSGSEFIADPYPTYRRLRDHAPAHRDERTGLWLITRYSDIENASSDYGTFSSSKGNVVIDSPTRVGKTLGSLDPPRHDELRRVIQRSLAPARIEAIVPQLRAETRARLAALADRRECDFIEDISRPLLFGALGRLLGLDAAAAAEASDLIADLFHQNDGPLGAILQPEQFRAVSAFLTEQLNNRTIQPGDDLFSVLLAAKEAGAALNEAEIVANLSTVLMAGSASIGHFLPNLIHALWLHPDQRKLVVDDRTRILAAIDEAVRWDTSTQCFARQVTRPVDVSGTVIPADSRVLLFYASANRDERVIPEPDTFDISRKRVRHFGFGMGPHICAGANVARTMLRTVLEEILDKWPSYELDPSSGRRVNHIMVRGFITLPFSW